MKSEPLAPAPRQSGGLHAPGHRLKRALLHAAASDAVTQDTIDCAELALEMGLRDLGTALYGLVSLELGRTSVSSKIVHDANDRWSLWDTLPLPIAGEHPGRFAFDLAVTALSALYPLEPALVLLPERTIDEPPRLPPASQEPRRMRALFEGMATDVGTFLRRFPVEDDGVVAEELAALHDRLIGLTPMRLEEHIDIDLAEMGRLFLLDRTRAFVVRNADVIVARCGKGSIFAASARLEPWALGPYFSNIGRLVRTARDVFTMTAAAADGAEIPDRDFWAVVLSAYLDPGQIIDFVDELSDRGMALALRHVLVRLSRMPAASHYHEALRRIRDGFIDLDELSFAREAQQLLVAWHGRSAEEWRILAQIAAAVRDSDAADYAHARALSLAGNDSNMGAIASCDAVTLRQGFGSAPYRARRRAALARAARDDATAR